MFEIGKIVNTQGIKGDVRVIPSTDDIKRFELLNTVLIVSKSNEVELEIENVWYHKNFVILKFKSVNDMTSAEKLKNSIIKIPDSEALPLDEGEYYIRDLYGMTVVEDGIPLGELCEILFTGANDVYVVRNKETKEEILIPAIKQCILNVDLENKVMDVSLLKGLRT